MRVSSKDVFAGYPVLEVRALLRRANGAMSIPLICRVMDVDEGAASALANALKRNGYVENAPRGEGWLTTVKGSAFAMASAGPPLKRATADKLLLEFLARVEQLRDEPHWCFKVDRAMLFGSYLSDAPTLGDVDVAISLRPTHVDRKSQEAAEGSRRTEAENAGRHFPTFVSRLFWPQHEVRQFLKARHLSLHDLQADMPVIEAGRHATIYEDGRVRPKAIPVLNDWTDDMSRVLRDAAVTTKAVAAQKRKLVALKKANKEKEENLATLLRFQSMSPEELGQHRDEVLRVVAWFRRNAPDGES